MSLVLSTERNDRQITAGLNSLAEAKRVLASGDVHSAASRLAEFRRSPVGLTAREVESDLLELQIQALQNPTQLVDRCSQLLPRHTGRNNEDRFLAGATRLIRSHANSTAALSWLRLASDPKRLFECGQGKTAALYLELLRETGRLEEARALAKEFLNAPCLTNPHISLWEQSITTVRGERPGKELGLEKRVSALAERLPIKQRLRLWDIASAQRVLIASTGGVTAGDTDSAKTLKLSVSFHRSQATLKVRQRDYLDAADHLHQAHDLSVQLHGGETHGSLELSLQQFEMLLLGGLVQPADNTWLTALRSIATQIGEVPHIEHRLANILRKAGYQELALKQYAEVAERYPQEQNGIRSAYQLAVNAEETGVLDDAESRYLKIASNPAAPISVAALCLIGAYRCAVRQNNEALSSQVIQSLRRLDTSNGTLREALLVVRQLRDDGLRGLADALLDQCVGKYKSLLTESTLPTRDYLGLTHLVVRRLYEANRYQDAISSVNGIGSSFWTNAGMAWGHLAGCLHYACLSWFALDNADKAGASVNSAAFPMSSRPTQSAHLDLALASATERSDWSTAEDLYNRIIAKAPFSSAAMKAKLRLARRAWQTGQVDEARQWALSVLFDGKRNSKDPDLASAYWEAYGLASSKPGTAAPGDTLVYPNLSAHQAMRRSRCERLTRIFRLG